VTKRRKRVLLILAPAVLLLVLVVVLIAPGSLRSYSGARASAPRWAAPCWKAPPRSDRQLLARCARLTGRVLWVRRQGYGAESKAELLLGSHFGMVLAKIAPYTRDNVPGVGRYVTIVGPLVKSRMGLREVQTFAVE
jgi:hypothetical protein